MGRELSRHSCALFGAKVGDQLAIQFSGSRQIFVVEGDGGNARVPSAAEFLRQRSEILVGRGLIPRIGTKGDLSPETRGADTHGIDALRVQQIGNELVIAFK